MRKTTAKRIRAYAERNRMVSADCRRMKRLWNATPHNQRERMARMLEG